MNVGDNQKYIILPIAGQSNAVGFDESVIKKDYVSSYAAANVCQLGYLEDDNLKPIPIGACAQNFQDMRPYGNPENFAPNLGTKGMHLPLGKLLSPYIPTGYNLIILPCAYGGCGFTYGEIPTEGAYDKTTLKAAPGSWRWGLNSPFYRAMRDRISYLLDQNENNRLLSVVWIQGEFDKDDPDGQINGFNEMTEDFFTFFQMKYPKRTVTRKWGKSIWFNVETASYWYQFEGCRKIWNHYKKWSFATYIPIPRETDSNLIGGTGITTKDIASHFGNDAFARVVAPRVASFLIQILKESFPLV